jgi:hypothetical protein
MNNYLYRPGTLPSVEAGARIARVLGVSVEQLVFGEGSQNAKALSNFPEKISKGQMKFAFELLKFVEARFNRKASFTNHGNIWT